MVMTPLELDDQTAVEIVGQGICAGQCNGFGGEVGAVSTSQDAVIQVHTETEAGSAGRAVAGGGDAGERDDTIAQYVQAVVVVIVELVKPGEGDILRGGAGSDRVIQFHAVAMRVAGGCQTVNGDGAFGSDEQTADVIAGEVICAGQCDGLGRGSQGVIQQRARAVDDFLMPGRW